MATPRSVDEYLAGLAAPERAALERLRAIVLAAAPGATDAISYQMPAVRWNGRVLLSYAAFRDHLSLFPWSAATIEALGDEVAAYRAGKGTLRFAVDAPIPDALVARIVAARIAELEGARPRG